MSFRRRGHARAKSQEGSRWEEALQVRERETQLQLKEAWFEEPGFIRAGSDGQEGQRKGSQGSDGGGRRSGQSYGAQSPEEEKNQALSPKVGPWEPSERSVEDAMLTIVGLNHGGGHNMGSAVVPPLDAHHHRSLSALDGRRRGLASARPALPLVVPRSRWIGLHPVGLDDGGGPVTVEMRSARATL